MLHGFPVLAFNNPSAIASPFQIHLTVDFEFGFMCNCMSWIDSTAEYAVGQMQSFERILDSIAYKYNDTRARAKHYKSIMKDFELILKAYNLLFKDG